MSSPGGVVNRLISITAVLLALAAAAACGRGENAPQIGIADSGSSLTMDTIAIAARVRSDPETVGPIRLRVTFRDVEGARVDETTDELPYCPARTDCWWAASFTVDQFDRSDAIRSADVELAGRPTRYTREARVLPFDVARGDGGRVHGTVPGDEGYVYLVGFVDGETRGGIFRTVTPEEGQDVYFAASHVAALGRDAELRAYFYPVRVAKGS